MTILTSISTTGFALFSLKGIFNAFEVVLASAIVYAIGSVIYNIFFHPLRHIPGPLFARATGLCFALHIRDGSVVKWIKECHDKYGDAVRLEPNEVSFISGETAWQDIYGHKQVRNKNAENFVKDLKWFPRPVNGVLSLLIADEEGHPRQRRNLSHAFSDKALRGQESLIQSYVDLLVRRLGEHAAEDEDIDMRTWYNFTTFDIISDLTFGEPLYCLRDSREHHWIFITLRSLQAIALHVSRGKHFVFRYLDFVRSLFTDNTGPMRARYEFAKRAHDMVSKRLEKIQSGEDTRPDFFTHIIKNQDKENTRLTRAEMDSNAVAFLIAGSETSATALAGATYLLLRNPQPYKKLVTEIRSRFSSADQITVDEVNKLDYLIAVFQEALRYYPPAATGLARVVPAGGDRVSGYYVPGGASVYVSMHAMGHSERNYRDPDAFVPERWLGDERYKDDKRAAHQPFSFGPRNCIGKTLAHAETRLILTKVLFAYDLELVDKETNWMDQKVFALWDKGPMMVKVKPAQQP